MKPLSREKKEWRNYLQDMGFSYTSSLGLMNTVDKYGVPYDIVDWDTIDPNISYLEQKRELIPMLHGLAPEHTREIIAEKLVPTEMELPTTREGLINVLYSVFEQEKNGEFSEHLKENIDTIIDISKKNGLAKEHATKFLIDKLPEILSDERKKFDEERKKRFESEKKQLEAERKLISVPVFKPVLKKTRVFKPKYISDKEINKLISKLRVPKTRRVVPRREKTKKYLSEHVKGGLVEKWLRKL